MKRIQLPAVAAVLLICLVFSRCTKDKPAPRPNILFCIADDWGWPHAGAYGDPVVQTPTFDKLAREGMLFENAFVSSPSCTPSRSAILTGQHFWRLKEAANLWSTLDINIDVYPLMLERAGYFVGSWRKAWGPGDITAGGYDTLLPAGTNFPAGFGQFLKERPENSPFCFWLGASDPHRGYEKGSGAASGMDINAIEIPAFYPDDEVIRNDIADYYYEVNRFDSDVARAISLLDSIGELENTIIVMTGDHGMPFPRSKGNLYDMGVRVPLAIRWGNTVNKNTTITEFVSLTDLAPTFLEMANDEVPSDMTGKSLKPLLLSEEEGPARSYALFGRERHTPAQLAPSLKGYPSRGIRTSEYLYIRNFFPERWPAGVPEGSTHLRRSFADVDDGPTKSVLIENPEYGSYYDLSFGQRPAEELYDIVGDPFQLVNIAMDSAFQSIKADLSKKLMTELKSTGDPRATDGTVDFDHYPYRAPYKLNLDN